MLCSLILLPCVKSSVYSMADDNSNASSNNSEPETQLPDFIIKKLSEMQPRRKVSEKKLYLTLMSTQGRFEQTEVRS